MKTDLNTLLTTLYVHLDDRILPSLGFSRDHHPGRKPALNDVELLCLLVAQHLLGIASDRKRIRYARTHLLDMFPALPQQSGWGKRVRQSTGLLSDVAREFVAGFAALHGHVREHFHLLGREVEALPLAAPRLPSADSVVVGSHYSPTR